ncbi:MAG: class II aldolase/adducin family protein [Nitrospinae bacterium]|nr:class II aldolase/adducin family protein [Nitrospinota bacterium]
MKTELGHRKDIVAIGKMIHARGWISSTDGNMSIKISEDRILTTPTGVHKGFMEEDDLILVDMDGKKVSGSRNPSSEIALHLACYKNRPDIGAVVHAHPTLCIAFSVAGIQLAQCLLPEVIFTLGSIPTADYAAPTTQDVPKSIEKVIKEYDAVILERHGSVTIGKTIFDAFYTLERMEHVAEITYHARALGNARPLSGAQVDELLKIRESLGLPGKKVTCNDCNACSKHDCSSSSQRETSSPAPAKKDDDSALVELITREVMAELRRAS